MDAGPTQARPVPAPPSVACVCLESARVAIKVDATWLLSFRMPMVVCWACRSELVLGTELSLDYLPRLHVPGRYSYMYSWQSISLITTHTRSDSLQLYSCRPAISIAHDATILQLLCTPVRVPCDTAVHSIYIFPPRDLSIASCRDDVFPLRMVDRVRGSRAYTYIHTLRLQ